ncbi:MAG: response regulator [Deltaproteobacteria bacterium]|nr:response regulator [Deltaproteobacteria bacterium]
MDELKILIVDDEKNIRLSLGRALEPLGHPVDTAVNGHDALEKLADPDVGLMLLDLHMPDLDGLEVLRRASQSRPDVRVIIITAYGTVEGAVEAMRLGAVDFLPKPFSSQEVRELVRRVLDRGGLPESPAQSYQDRLELAKKAMQERQFRAALEHARLAVSLDPYRAEGFNLLGALHEILGERAEAITNYRMAIEADPTYRPSQENLERLVAHAGHGSITWEDDGAAKKKP